MEKKQAFDPSSEKSVISCTNIVKQKEKTTEIQLPVRQNHAREKEE